MASRRERNDEYQGMWMMSGPWLRRMDGSWLKAVMTRSSVGWKWARADEACQERLACRFQPRGQTVADVGDDKTIKLWDGRVGVRGQVCEDIAARGHSSVQPRMGELLASGSNEDDQIVGYGKRSARVSLPGRESDYLVPSRSVLTGATLASRERTKTITYGNVERGVAGQSARGIPGPSIQSPSPG